MLHFFDYLVVGFYFVFMTAVGWIFKRFIRNTSDYFRSGGEMLWWIAGAGAFMVSFSAVTFTGMAGKAYTDGPVVLVIFVGNAIGFFLNFLWFAPASRQTRAVTAMDVVRARFGKVSEQFFTWIQIPVGTFYAGIWLMGLCIFVSTGFGMPLNTTIILTGVVVLVMALLGGSWSVVAGDFMQMLVLMPVSIVAAVYALAKVGGPRAFFVDAPTGYWDWSQAASVNVIGLWVVATLLQKFISTNSMNDCSRYLSVKNSSHARKAAFLGFVLFVVGPAVWFIPPMAARIAYPDLKPMFPGLENPQEAAYFAIAVQTMPVGMVGLLLSGIFGATMSSMDGGLNKNAGFFVKNFYHQQLRPQASERELLLASKLATLVLGLLIILAGLVAANWRGLTIFELMTYFSGLVGVPVAVPLVLGMIFKRAPDWAGWSTVLIGLATSLVVSGAAGVEGLLSPGRVGEWIGFTFNKREMSDWVFIAGTLSNIAAQGAWFAIACAIGYKPADLNTLRFSRVADLNGMPQEKRIPALFALMKKPVDFEAEEKSGGSDNAQARIMGTLSLVYGTFVALLALIPNPFVGRISFLFCGGTMLAIGAILRRRSRRQSSGSTT
jgi:solute:Na+ symporter, SSS family